MKTRQHEYLKTMLDCITRIETYVADGRQVFMTSPLIQDAVIRNFEIIGEIVRSRLSTGLISQQPQIPWRSIGDFRNTLIHEYDQVDLVIVWNAIESHLPPLKTAVLALLAQFDPPPAQQDSDHESSG